MILKVCTRWSSRFFLSRVIPCLLGLILVIQLLFLWLVLSARTVSLPTGAVNWLERTLSTQQWQVSLQGATWRPPGHIQLHQLAVTHFAFREPILLAEEVEGGWGIDSLLWLDGRPSTLRIHGLDLAVPSLLSSSGSKEVLANKVYVEVMRRGRWWHIEQADGYLFTVPFSLNGRWYLRPGLSFSGHREKPILDVQELQGRELAQVIRPLADLQNELRGLKNPLLRIQIERNPAGDVVADAAFIAEAVDDLRQVSSAQVRLDGSLAITAALQHAQVHMSLEAAAPRWSDHLRAESISARAQGEFSLREGAARSWPVLALVLRDVAHEHYELQYIGLEVDPAGWPLINGSVLAGNQSDLLRVGGKVDVQAGSAQLAYNGEVALASYFPWVAALGQDAAEVLGSIKVEGQPVFEGSLQIAPGWKPQEVDLWIQGQGLAYHDLSVIEYSSNVHYQFAEQKLLLSDAHLFSNHYEVQGSFSADLAQQRYRYLLTGSIDPRDLNAVLEEEWWDHLWEEFSFASGVLPSADMDIAYQRENDRYHNAYFGSIAWEDVRFRSIPYDSVTMRLYVSPDTLTLYDLQLQRDGKRADAILQWVYDEDGDVTHIDFSGVSQLNLHAVAATAGPEVLDVVSGFSADSWPRLKIAGRILSDAEGNVEEVKRVAFNAEFDHELNWDGFDFQELTIHGNYQDDVLYISPAVFRIAGGSGTGSVRYDLRPQVPTVTATMNLNGANHFQLLHSLPWTREASDWDQKAIAAQSELDIELELTGQAKEIDSYSGQGKFVLQNADLGKIHLFGGLSRALDWDVIHLGSFEVDTAIGGFSIDTGRIYLSGVTVEGPTLRLEADGSFTFEDKQLDLGITVYPIGALEAPVLRLLSKAFDPVSRTFQVTVTGNWDDPKYKVRFSPLQLFSLDRNPAANGVETIEKKQANDQPDPETAP